MKKELILDPRQQLATSYYRDPKSESFGNLKRSMIRAGFSPQYASNQYDKNIEWINNAKDVVKMITKSEKTINDVLDYPISFKDKTKYNVDMIKTKVNVAMFTLKTLAKSKYDEDAQDTKPSVQINIVNYNAPDDNKEVQEATVIEPE